MRKDKNRMAKQIEETIKKCGKCKKKTKHMRNGKKTGFVMALVHVVLVIVTAGIWLIPLIIWHLLNKSIGGWTCEECGS